MLTTKEPLSLDTNWNTRGWMGMWWPRKNDLRNVRALRWRSVGIYPGRIIRTVIGNIAVWQGKFLCRRGNSSPIAVGPADSYTLV